MVPYLTGDEMRIILSQPDGSTKEGYRDLVLLSVLYDTAADSLAYPGRRLSPTMASADFSQFIVTTANGTACET